MAGRRLRKRARKTIKKRKLRFRRVQKSLKGALGGAAIGGGLAGLTGRNVGAGAALGGGLGYLLSK
jgi:hypothetical protein